MLLIIFISKQHSTERKIMTPTVNICSALLSLQNVWTVRFSWINEEPRLNDRVGQGVVDDASEHSDGAYSATSASLCGTT
jgi:hypothetical protein